MASSTDFISTDKSLQDCCWKPENLYSLSRNQTEYDYNEFDDIMRVMHFYDYVQVHEKGAIIPYPITNQSRSSLPYGLSCSWFGIATDPNNHNFYGNVGCKVNFKAFLSKFNPKCYFVDVAEFKSTNSSRLLFTTQDVRNLELTEYNPNRIGGPWYATGEGKNKYLTNTRRQFNCRNNWHSSKLEILIMLNQAEYKTLFQMCRVEAVNHEAANSNRPLDCIKSKGGICRSPWNVGTCTEKLQELSQGTSS